MLINCKKGCRLRQDGMTTAKLDIETNKAMCEFCDEEIEITSFAKAAMKSKGDVIKKNKNKAFSYKCQTCSEIKEVCMEGKLSEKVVGINCKNDCNCKFEINKFAFNALKASQRYLSDYIEDENESK